MGLKEYRNEETFTQENLLKIINNLKKCFLFLVKKNNNKIKKTQQVSEQW